jgi:TolB-like protein
MNKILMMLMLLVSTNVLAVDWVKVGTRQNTHYVDSQSIRRDGNKVRAWTLADYKSGTFLSILEKAEFDCFEDTMRVLDAYAYSGNMGTGDIVHSS